VNPIPCYFSVGSGHVELEAHDGRSGVVAADERQHLFFTHTVNDKGDKVFTVSDPVTARGNGDGAVTDSYHNAASNEWRAAIRFPFADGFEASAVAPD
jgi:hypothetical protein